MADMSYHQTPVYGVYKRHQDRPSFFFYTGDFDEQINQLLRAIPGRIGIKNEETKQFYWVVPLRLNDPEMLKEQVKAINAVRHDRRVYFECSWAMNYAWCSMVHPFIFPERPHQPIVWHEKSQQWVYEAKPRDDFERDLMMSQGAQPFVHQGRHFMIQPLNWAFVAQEDPYFEKALPMLHIDVDKASKKRFEVQRQQAYQRLLPSYADQSDHVYPVPADCPALKPYQNAAIHSMIQRDRILLGDDPGLGKTAQVISVINHDPSKPKNILIVCPATLKLNWLSEWNQWSLRPDLQPVIIQGRKDHEQLANNSFVIMNYDVLSYYADELRQREWDIIAVDEAHALKNRMAARTKALVGNQLHHKRGEAELNPVQGKKIILMSGTPLGRGVYEAFVLLNYLDPKQFPDRVQYGRRYCHSQIKFGKWSFNGASHTEELQCILREKLMIRREKKDVLKQLPPKIRQVVVLDAPKIAQEEKKSFVHLMQENKIDMNTDQVFDIAVQKPHIASEISAIRRETALSKIPYVEEYVQLKMDDESKVILFATHHEVLDALHAMCRNNEWNFAFFDGRNTMNERQEAQQRFQNDPECRIIVLGIIPAGVGITLTAADEEIFVEQEWVPHIITQAEDRAWRLGLDHPVVVSHLVVQDSIDAYMIQKVIKRQAQTDAVMNKEKLNVDINLDVPLDQELVASPSMLPENMNDANQWFSKIATPKPKQKKTVKTVNAS